MNEIQQWINDPARNYEAGVELFARHSSNKALVRFFQTGTARFRMGKLVYEMGKVAKMAADERANEWANKQPSTVHQAPQTHSNTANSKGQIKDRIIPDFILAAKKEIFSLYGQIGRIHNELYDTGTSNADNIVRHRKHLLDSREPLCYRADRLYTLKEEWLALNDGTARDNVADAIREMLAAQCDEQPVICHDALNVSANSESRGASLQTDVSGLTDLQLSKRRSTLRSAITKTQNMLQYQSIRKSKKSSPMPSGAKRDTYEAKLARLMEEYTAVTEELKRRSK